MGGCREEDAGCQISSPGCREKWAGREPRPVVAIADYREEFTLELMELFRSLGCTYLLYPLSFLPLLDRDQSGAI